MMRLRRFAALSVAAVSFTALDATAAIDPAAAVVLLRTSCNDGAGNTFGGSVHIHGTGIDIISTGTAPALITALDASNGATIHANASAFNLSTAAGGSVTRINTNNGSGHIHAPYLWEHIPNAVAMPGFTSQDGADMTTVIASDGKPHMVVYSATCPANARWCDQVDKVCRSQ